MIVAILLSFLWTPSLVSADRGGIPVIPEGGQRIDLNEPGQRAIIAWNGHEEILILSTDVKANRTTLVLEILPLPSNPSTVEKANEESFVKIQEITENHLERFFYHYRTAGGVSEDKIERVVVTFHKKIGAHDITVVKAEKPSDLALWVERFLERNGVTSSISLEEYRTIFEDYIERGFNFFALDLVEVSPEKESVEPILYHFKTDFLYYPLKISSLFSGNTKITLFLLTHYPIDVVCYFRMGPYVYGEPRLWASIPIYVDYRNETKVYEGFANQEWGVGRPIQFNITKNEIAEIDSRLEQFFDSAGGSAILTILEYRGALRSFTGDLILREGETLITYPFVPSPSLLRPSSGEIPAEQSLVPTNILPPETLRNLKVSPYLPSGSVPIDYRPPLVNSVRHSILIDGSVMVRCGVEDSQSGVYEVKLFYRAAGEVTWSSVKMVRVGEAFEAAIPIEPYRDIQFYLVATDLAGNIVVEDNDQAYYVVDVASNTTALILRYVGLTLVCILTAASTALIIKFYVERRLHAPM